MVTISPVNAGRGAWPVAGIGGTLDVKGLKLGPYYKAPAVGSTMKMPGLIAALAVRNGTSCTVNEYAVFMAVKALQPYFNATPDGILGPKTDAAIRLYQNQRRLVVDGAIGPQTSRSLFGPLVMKAAKEVDSGLLQLASIASGHIGFESQWDAGAVGYTTPDDLGLGQINGPSHPGMSIDARLTPWPAIRWLVEFVDDNIKAMAGNIRDGIAAYNLGIGGAQNWVRAGRPDIWTRDFRGVTYVTEVKSYIDHVLSAALL